MILLLIALRFTYIHVYERERKKGDKWTAAAKRISLTLPHLIRSLPLAQLELLSQKKNLFLHVFSSHNF